MKHGYLRMIGLVAALCALGCESGSTTTDAGTGPADAWSPSVQGSCDRRASDALCMDHVFGYSAGELATLESNCTAAGGTWSTSACSITGTLGGCSLTDPVAAVNDVQWIFAGDAAAAQASCESGGGTWIAP